MINILIAVVFVLRHNFSIDMAGKVLDMVGEMMDMIGEVMDMVGEVMDMVGEMKAIVREGVDGLGWGSDGHVQGMKDMAGEVMD